MTIFRWANLPIFLETDTLTADAELWQKAEKLPALYKQSISVMIIMKISSCKPDNALHCNLTTGRKREKNDGKRDRERQCKSGGGPS